MFGWGLGQDGTLPLLVLDPTAIHPLCPTKPFSSQSGGQIWCGPSASQIHGESHPQARLGQAEEPGILKVFSSSLQQSLFFCDLSMWGFFLSQVSIIIHHHQGTVHISLHFIWNMKFMFFFFCTTASTFAKQSETWEDTTINLFCRKEPFNSKPNY